MIVKPYDEKLDANEGTPAERETYKLLCREHGAGLVRMKPHGIYGVDFAVDDPDTPLYVEVECHTSWFRGDCFQYPTIHLPARKIKFMSLDRPTVFLTWRRDLSRVAVTRSEQWSNAPSKLHPNALVSGGDTMLELPIEDIIGYYDWAPGETT